MPNKIEINIKCMSLLNKGYTNRFGACCYPHLPTKFKIYHRPNINQYEIQASEGYHPNNIDAANSISVLTKQYWV